MHSNQKSKAVQCNDNPVAGTIIMTDSNKSFHFPPLESNPQIFTSYLHQTGLSSSVAVGEIYGFDEDLLAFIPRPVYGVIACFERLKKDDDKRRGSEVDVNLVDFYMKQTGKLDNACGIIACLHAALNNTPDVEYTPDSVIGRFMETTKDGTPMDRCRYLEESNEFKTVHSEFASRGQTDSITDSSKQDEIKHHFVAYVVKGGKLIELDGTKNGPYVVGDCTDVLRGSVDEIQRRLREGEISESLNMMTLNAAG